MSKQLIKEPTGDRKKGREVAWDNDIIYCVSGGLNTKCFSDEGNRGSDNKARHIGGHFSVVRPETTETPTGPPRDLPSLPSFIDHRPVSPVLSVVTVLLSSWSLFLGVLLDGP